MMQSLAALRQKPPDHGILRSRLQQLDPAVAQRQHRGLHLLVLDRLHPRHSHPQQLVKPTRRRDAPHGNP